ncbi:hypothetical protein Tco_1123694 [Tanacetum coccineum]|uniref:Zinc finger, CCHC-type n=1 Tax=Tanacetum coccineum TaxID=301880 RepID=A0ABQ5J4D1_9ASTR
MKDLGEAEVILGIRIKRENNGTPVSQLEYSRAIGCLMYAMISTRPDIAFAVGKLSRLYLVILQYRRFIPMQLDNNWRSLSYSGVGYSSERGGYFLGSRNRRWITSSTMESEFVALAAAGNEAEWLRNLVYEIPL